MPDETKGTKQIMPPGTEFNRQREIIKNLEGKTVYLYFTAETGGVPAKIIALDETWISYHRLGNVGKDGKPIVSTTLTSKLDSEGIKYKVEHGEVYDY